MVVSTLYSVSSRDCSTSNCRSPTTARIGSERNPSWTTKNLHRASSLELFQPFLETALRVVTLARESREVLRREARDAVELDRCTRGDGVSDWKRPGLLTKPITSPDRRVDGLALPREEAMREGHCALRGAAGRAARPCPSRTRGGDAHERQAVAMALVHVRLDLEPKPCEVSEWGSSSISSPFCFACRGERRRRKLDHGAEERLDAEVVDRAAEEDRDTRP